MSLYLHTNLSSIQAQRAVGRAGHKLDVSYERLSSGLRINSAKDDPAGVQTADRLTNQIDSLYETNRIAQNGISYAQTAEGAMDEITTMLQRIRTLALSAANGTYTPDDRRSLQKEVDQLSAEISRIADKTTFGGQELLSGAASVAQFQISPQPNAVIKIDLSISFDIAGLAEQAAKLTSGSFTVGPNASLPTAQTYFYSGVFQMGKGGIDITTPAAAETVLAGVDALINAIDTKRGELGAIQNRLESTIRNQSNVRENVSSARAQIRDTDWAEETANLTAQQILQQGAVSILTQANQRSQIALQILET